MLFSVPLFYSFRVSRWCILQAYNRRSRYEATCQDFESRGLSQRKMRAYTMLWISHLKLFNVLTISCLLIFFLKVFNEGFKFKKNRNLNRSSQIGNKKEGCLVMSPSQIWDFLRGDESENWKFGSELNGKSRGRRRKLTNCSQLSKECF